MRTISRVTVGVCLALAMVFMATSVADASPDSVDGVESVEGVTHSGDSPNDGGQAYLCNNFRPYGVGFVTFHLLFQDTTIFCRMVYDNLCWQFEVRWWGGWNGPYAIHNVPYNYCTPNH